MTSNSEPPVYEVLKMPSYTISIERLTTKQLQVGISASEVRKSSEVSTFTVCGAGLMWTKDPEAPIWTSNIPTGYVDFNQISVMETISFP